MCEKRSMIRKNESSWIDFEFKYKFRNPNFFKIRNFRIWSPILTILPV